MTRNTRGRRHDDPRVSFVAGDVRDQSSLRGVCTGVDVIVHSVQFPNHPVENPRRGETYMAIDAEGTRRLVAAAKATGVRRVVYLSGAGVGPDRPQNWYRAKWIAETAVRESGLEWVILRPSWVYGPGDRSMSRFVAFSRLPFIPVIGDGRNKIQPVFVGDVARVAAGAVVRADANGHVFELGGPDDVTMDELLRTLLRVLGKRRVLLHLPPALMKVLTWPLGLLPHPPLSPAAVEFVIQEAPVDSRPALGFFGVEFTGLEVGLRSYLK
jgi:NADH dehydrogenase